MSQNARTTYTAADRFERRARRQGRPAARRQGTRHAVVRSALQEA